MVLSGVPWKKSPVTPPGIGPGTVRPVAQRLNQYATPAPRVLSVWNKAFTENAIGGIGELSKRFKIPLKTGKRDFSIS